jgi:hydroxyacylglutathione hydrolase
MSLEDHAGDIVRKARLMDNIPPMEVALAGRIEEDALREFESSGRPPKDLAWGPLARKLRLSEDKLRRIAEGWQPAALDLAPWRSFRQITTSGGGMDVNCYLVWDPVTRDAALFDTGFDAAEVLHIGAEQGLQLRHIFVTHSHSDHIAAMEPLRGRFPEIALHTNAPSAPSRLRNRPEEVVQLGSLSVSNRETPGHADDAVTYIVRQPGEQAPALAIVGDAIFAGSIGGATGKGNLARDIIQERILSLPDNTILCPGHGPLTTVGEQKQFNPFFE